MTRYARHRIRIVLVAIFCLLFQQAALAGYLCPIEQMPAEMSAMAEHCAGMGMAEARDNPALCAKHCNPDHTTTPDTAKVSVPPLALPAMAYAPIFVQPVSCATMHAAVPITRSDPPPRLRYCSLLI